MCLYILLMCVCVPVSYAMRCVFITQTLYVMFGLSYEHSALLSFSISLIFIAAVVLSALWPNATIKPNSIKIIAKIKTKNIYTTSTSSTHMSKYTYQHACERLIQFVFIWFHFFFWFLFFQSMCKLNETLL